MALQQDKRDVLEMVDQINNAKLMANIKEILAEMLSPVDFALSDAHKRIMDRRIEKYQSGKGHLFSWEEVVEGARTK